MAEAPEKPLAVHVPWTCPRCGKSATVNLAVLGPLGAVRCTCGKVSQPDG